MKTTFKSTLKKVFVLLLAVGLAFSAYGCKKGGQEPSDSTNGGDNLTVWTANSQVKVNRYSEEALPELEPLTIEMGKNEKEGAQIIFRAKEDIKEYQIKVSRLTCGMAFIPTSDIEIFNEKYIEITKRTSTNTAFPIGSFVPDALLPFDVAVEYGENTVKKGENQGVFGFLHILIYIYLPSSEQGSSEIMLSYLFIIYSASVVASGSSSFGT